jgi:hypothetical protein
MTKRLLALIITLASAGAASAVAAGPEPVVLARGQCANIGPVAGRWDVYEDMFQADAPTWLPAHTHKGIECTLGIRGTTMWWFHGTGKQPIGQSTALYTQPGRVHTAGNDGPAPMAYFATHVLVAGSPYRTLVADPTAPAQVSTNGKSLFHSIFPNQTMFARLPMWTFTTFLVVESLPPGATIPLRRGSIYADGIAYYTVISGRVVAGKKSYGQYGKWVGGGVRNPGPAPAVLGVVTIFPNR